MSNNLQSYGIIENVTEVGAFSFASIQPYLTSVPLCDKKRQTLDTAVCLGETMNIDKEKLDRVLELVDIRGEDDCWEWQGGKTSRGYGHFWNGEKMSYAHRLAYQHAYGEIMDGLLVCHRCDNPKCCNPKHLFLGTQKDNMADASKKGRIVSPGLFGSKHPNAKLTEDGVREIRNKRAGGQSLSEIARDMGVCKGTIVFVLKRSTWKHVKDGNKEPTPEGIANATNHD